MADYSQAAIDTYNASIETAEQALEQRVDAWQGVPETEPHLARVDYDTAAQSARDTLESSGGTTQQAAAAGG